MGVIKTIDNKQYQKDDNGDWYEVPMPEQNPITKVIDGRTYQKDKSGEWFDMGEVKKKVSLESGGGISKIGGQAGISEAQSGKETPNWVDRTFHKQLPEQPVQEKIELTPTGKKDGGIPTVAIDEQNGGVGKIGGATIKNDWDKFLESHPVVYAESKDPIGDAIESQRREAAKFIYPDETTGKPSGITSYQMVQAIGKLNTNTAIIENAFGDDPKLAEAYLQKALGEKGAKLSPKSDGKIPGLSDYNAAQQQKKVAETPIDNFDTNEIAKAIDPHNKTEVAAFKTLKRGRDLQHAIQTGTTIDDMAAKFRGENISELPKSKAGQIVDDFLNEPKVQQLAQSNPEFGQMYREEKSNLYNHYPAFAQKKVAQEIGQKLEDEKMTGWLYANPSVKKVDKAVKMLMDEGHFTPQEIEVYEKLIRPYAIVGASDVVIPLSDVVHNAGYGIYKAGANVLSSTRDIINKTVGGGFLDPQGNSLFQNLGLLETNQDRMKRLENEEYSTPHVIGSTPFRRTAQQASEFVGFTLPMMGAAAAGVPNALTMGLMFEGENADQARKFFPKDMGAQMRYTAIGTGIDVMLGDLLPTKRGVAGIKRAFMNDAKGVIEDLANKKITQDAAQTELGEKIFHLISNTVKGNAETGLVLTAFDKAHKIVNAAFGKGTFNIPDEIMSAIDDAKTNFLTPTGLSAMGAIGKMPNNAKIKEKIYLDAANNPERYETGIAAKEKTNPTLAKEMRENLTFLVDLNKSLKEHEVPEESAGKYMALALREKALKADIKTSPDDFLKRRHDKELRGISVDKEKLADPEMTNTDYIEKLYNEELIPKSDRMYIENNETGKFEPNKVGEYLKYVAQQANNLAEDWTPHEGEAPKMEHYSPLLVEAANKRWEKEINEALDKKAKSENPPIDQNREVEDKASNVGGDVDFTANGGNKVVDDKGEPLTVYHGTDFEFENFDIGKAKKFGKFGIWFADDKNAVEAFGGKVKESQISLKNPKIISWEDWNKIRDAHAKDDNWFSDWKQKLISEGHDGLKVEGSKEQFAGQEVTNPTTYAVFSNEQIKQPLSKQESGGKATENETNQEGVEGIKPEQAEEKPQPKKTITENTEGAEPPKTAPGEEKSTEESGVGGITHAANEVRRKDRLLPEYEKTPQSFEEWNNEAEKAIKEGYDVDILIDRIEKGHDPTPVENAIRKMYVATLDAEIAKNPTDALLARQKRFIEVGDLANSRAGRNLVSLKGQGSPLESISDFYVAKMEAAGVDKLTEKQKKETEKAFYDVKRADENATAAMEAYREEIAKLKAENELLKQKKTPTKKGDYAQQRKDAVAGAREALKKIRTGESGVGVSVPLIRELVAIAPHVKKYVSAVLGDGVHTLKEVVTKAYEEFKDILEGITEKDIHDIIAGEYNEKKPTRNELAAKMRDLRDEAYYINKLERLLNGTEPKNEKKKVERNRQITELKKKIKDFQKEERDAAKEPKEIVDADLAKLMAIKKSNEKQEAEIRERIAKGEFEKEKKKPFLEDPEMQKKFPKQYNAALDAIKKKEDARHEFDIALLRDQMARRTLAEKATDNLSKTAGTVKAITTGIDDSAVAIQTYVSMLVRPRTGASAFYQHIRQGFSQKKFDRWLTALHSSADYKEMKEMGLDVTEPSSLKEREKEEIFNNRFNGTVKIKGKEYKLIDAPLKPFERAFTTLGNVTRVVGYRTISAKYKREGFTPEKNPELFKSLATRLNTETGRGNVNEYVDKANKVVTMGIWSPKLMATKFNILGISDLASTVLSKAGTKGYYRQLHPKERAAAIKDVAQFATTVMVLSYGLALSFGGTVDDDPLSSTFLDVKMPNGKSYNLSGGFSGYIRAISQFAMGKKHKDGEDAKAGRLETAGRFFRGKVPPITGAILNLSAGKDFMGQPTSLRGEALKLFPISLQGINQQINNDGASSFFTQGIPTFMGFNVKNEKDYPTKTMKVKDPDTYKEREISEEEFKKYKEAVKKIEGGIFLEYDKSEIYVDVNGKIHLDYPKAPEPNRDASKEYIEAEDSWKPIFPKNLTSEQRKEYEQKIKERAKAQAKKELFGDDSDE